MISKNSIIIFLLGLVCLLVAYVVISDFSGGEGQDQEVRDFIRDTLRAYDSVKVAELSVLQKDTVVYRKKIRELEVVLRVNQLEIDKLEQDAIKNKKRKNLVWSYSDATLDSLFRVRYPRSDSAMAAERVEADIQ